MFGQTEKEETKCPRTEPGPETAKLGARVRALRAERHMSLGDLADLSLVSKGHLSSIEHGLCCHYDPNHLRLAKGLEVPPFYLLVSPTEDDRDQIAELVGNMPRQEIVKLRRELTKSIKEAAKAASKAARLRPFRATT